MSEIDFSSIPFYLFRICVKERFVYIFVSSHDIIPALNGCMMLVTFGVRNAIWIFWSGSRVIWISYTDQFSIKRTRYLLFPWPVKLSKRCSHSMGISMFIQSFYL